MPTYYGQQGEDKILHQVFKDNPGFYVEVGAVDGVFLSNTYFFDKLGWSGICIEPNPVMFEKLIVNRPKSIRIKAVAGEANVEGVGFLADSNYGLSKRTNDVGDIKVPMITLDYLFDILGVTHVDILSVDAEYHNYQVIKGLNKVTPRIIVIEDDENGNLTRQKLLGMGYRLAKKHYFNEFYCLRAEDIPIIKSFDPRMENGVDLR